MGRPRCVRRAITSKEKRSRACSHPSSTSSDLLIVNILSMSGFLANVYVLHDVFMFFSCRDLDKLRETSRVADKVIDRMKNRPRKSNSKRVLYISNDVVETYDPFWRVTKTDQAVDQLHLYSRPKCTIPFMGPSDSSKVRQFRCNGPRWYRAFTNTLKTIIPSSILSYCT
ncbi:unnamed protein product [Bursaphelenchus okinawaensis]|uniref:Uncharacterized protein n=1 Tax=Bursaphelenchus okinawaensis TaxID=465554 RepID=A0A811K948_9BILA|nr:unnamed protein product [Bursaphelenchus okinawaensis]CAG9094675.1 unnamed protein product [Bursaphelenchus okinawaensis]